MNLVLKRLLLEDKLKRLLFLLLILFAVLNVSNCKTSDEIEEEAVIIPVIDWIKISEGEFTMGDSFNESLADSLGLFDEKPVHKVYLNEYHISKYEITHEQYIAFLNDKNIPPDNDNLVNPTHHEIEKSFGYLDLSDIDCAIAYNEENEKYYFKANQYANTINTPVIEVYWYGAVAFCEWLSEKKGENIHLPTEAQWEKAARGTDQRRYPWGNDLPNSSRCNYDSVNNGDNFNYNAPVGSFPDGASPYGVMDMAGNVWEWCQDYYKTDYYSESPYENPQGPPVKDDKNHTRFPLLRGGSWYCDDYSLRSSNRLKAWFPERSRNDIGFRVARD